MEPLDPTRIDESSGFSKRRISSILKAPRKSTRVPDPEQQEKVVECVKPVEKRNSRRVSFAPANNVLLFSSDAKNASPQRSPLQDVMTTAAATKNRVQVEPPEDGNQQITGMETLLSAPLYASQERDTVCFNAGGNFGEKTVMFPTDDAFMDMTHSQTINIANDEEVLGDISQNYDVFPTSREKAVMFPASDGSMDITQTHTLNIRSGSLSQPAGRSTELSVEKSNIYSSLPCLDPEFENFLASLFKPSAPSANPVVTSKTLLDGSSSEETSGCRAQIKMPRAVVDKENQAPVLAVMEKSVNASRKMGEASYGRPLSSKHDTSMDITESQTGRIRGFKDDDTNIPTQDTYPLLDNTASLTAETIKRLQSSKTMASFNPKDTTSSRSPLHATQQRHKVNLDTKDECREKTIMYSADDEFMDMTQCHTVSISSGSLAHANKNRTSSLEERRPETCAPPCSSAKGLDPGFKNFVASVLGTSAPSGTPEVARMVPAAASLLETVNKNSDLSQLKSDACEENESLNDVSMDMTETQTGRILGISDSDCPLQFIYPTQDTYLHCEGLKRAELSPGEEKSDSSGSFNSAGMDTSLRPSSKAKEKMYQVKFSAEEDCSEKTVRFTAEEACMDVTKSLTVNISADFDTHPFLSHPNLDFSPAPGDKTVRFTANEANMDITQSHTLKLLPACGEKTVRFNADDAAMDVTQSHTVNIATGFDLQSHRNVDFLPALGERTVRFTATDAAMDVTRSHTVNIATDFGNRSQQNADFLPAFGEKTVKFSSNEACMDMTQCHTVNIASDLKPQSRQNVDFLPACGEKTMRFSAKDACMDMTQCHTVNIASDLKPQSRQNVEFVPACGEKTMRFSAKDACMDMTQCHTVNIASDLKPLSRQNVEFVPACGEKTMRFSAKDACMDMTQSHTVNIASDLKPQSPQNVDFLPACGEKTMRFSAKDAGMDMTQCHIINIASDLKSDSQPNIDFVPNCGEKTVRFTATDAAMDVTRSHTVNIATDLDMHQHRNLSLLTDCGEKTKRFSAKEGCMDMTQSHTVKMDRVLKLHSRQYVDLTDCGEKTMRFTATDAAMEVTKSLTVNIATDFNNQSHQNLEEELMRSSGDDAAVDATHSCSVNLSRNLGTNNCPAERSSDVSSAHENMDNPPSLKKREGETSNVHRSRSSSEISPSKTTGPSINPMITKNPHETRHTKGFLESKAQNEATDIVSTVTEDPVNNTVTDSAEDDRRLATTKKPTGEILGQTGLDEPPICLSSAQVLYSDANHLNKAEVTSEQSKGSLETSDLNGADITNPTYFDPGHTDDRKEPEPTNPTFSPNAVDAAPSRKSRRASLADLHSKIRRLSHKINTAPDSVVTEAYTTPLPLQEKDVDKNSKDKTKALPLLEEEPKMGLVNTEENTQAQCLVEEEKSSTTPFKLTNKKLLSKLSLGGFKPKLPQRSQDSKKANLVAEQTKTLPVSFTNQLSPFDNDVSDINDEELGSCEDMSEMLDPRSPQKISENLIPFQEFHLHGPLEEDLFVEDLISNAHIKKRNLPVDENDMKDEKRMKPSPETATDFHTGSASHLVECDGNTTTAPSTSTHTTDDSSNSHTATVRCEATFESTFKQSLFESQLEDYACDMQRKFDDGTMTVLEFFKIFNIDFVIHNPRQSVRPEKLPSDTDLTPMDLLKDKHVNHPKQMVYETDVLTLTERVEGLKERMRDLDKPLKIVNRPLWEEMRNSSEKELKSFGAKLKERNNLFRKTSKAQSHEMKEGLYANLVRANLEEQQRLRGTIEEADQMLKSLDDCICELQTEIAAVEEKDFKNTPSLKSCQEEMKKVTESLADNERQISELEMQKTHNSNKLHRLKAETRKLEDHLNMLQLVNEWKIGASGDNSIVYTFLHDTFHLQLVYETLNENDDDPPEKKILNLTFTHQLDVEKSRGHARLVHKLLQQYVEGESALVEKYPTISHVPNLLHDVGLVVSRCRLLGEELRLLKMWGSLRLDILSISCVDTRVQIVFSSLKKFSKFEVIFSVSLTDNLCTLQVESFKNMIGNTTVQQIEEIVVSFSPGRNLLTKIVKKIHESLLC